MKQLFYILIFCCLSIRVIAQNEDIKSKFMDHLSVSIEAGTTGFGFEVATTLHPNFMLRAGFVMLPSSSTDNAYISFYGNGDDHFNDLIKEMPQIKVALEDKKLPTDSKEIFNEVTMTDKYKLYNGKILVDYYPSAKKTFHVTAGLYFGDKNIITSRGQLPSEYVEAVHVINQYLPEDAQFMPAVSRGDGFIKDCFVEASPFGTVKYSRQISPIKPYIGIGAGRAIPNKRIGCQFDFGIIFQGKQRMASEYYIEDLWTNFLNCPVIPIISLKLAGRIF